jgi:hypothetical protein
MATRSTIGKWILPQPKDAQEKGEYISIPKLNGRFEAPFGYKTSETDPLMLDPIPLELDALEKAKKYLKQYPSREVAAWLNKVTGRYISHVGLLSRIKHEQYHQTKASTLRSWAAKYRKAIEEAEKHEKRLGGKATRQARAVLNRIDGGDECEEYW